MDLQHFASRLRAERYVVAGCVAVGLVFVGLLIAFVRSQVGFVLAGPLLFFPWALLCVAFSRNLSIWALRVVAAFALASLAWPLLYI